MRILIVRLSSLGDVVCSLPAATTLRSAFPDAKIEWASDPRFAAIVEACDAVDLVHQVKPKFAPSSWPSFEGEYDAVLDLQGLSKSAIVAARAKAKLKLGYHWQREGAWLVSNPVMPDPNSIHIVDQYADVARAATVALGGAVDPLLRTTFGLTSRVDVSEKLTKASIDRPYVLMNPGAGWVSKRWPATSFAKVADWIWGKGLVPVALGGNAAEDHAAFAEVAQAADIPPIAMTGKTNIAELVALVAGARAHIGGDTGSTHLAAALGIPAIGLYSITRPARSCPYGQGDRCLYDPTGLDRIPPEDAIRLIEAALAP